MNMNNSIIYIQFNLALFLWVRQKSYPVKECVAFAFISRRFIKHEKIGNYSELESLP